MPTARGNAGQLRAAVLHWLVHGELPPPRVDGGKCDGLVEAFVLHFDWAARTENPAVVDEVRRLWATHADEILARTPVGCVPWAVCALENTHTDKEQS